MQATVDHVSIGVGDLQQGIATLRALGFELRTEAEHAWAETPTAAVELVAARSPQRAISIACDQPPPAPVEDAAIPLRFVAAPGRQPRTGSHPNGVLHLERVYVTVPDVRAVAARYARLLGLPLPTVQRGNVIKADMCVFSVGGVGIGVAQPVEPGPAAEALERAGAGLFQLLFRTRSLTAATRWMTEQGLSPPARGTRNTGEPAMLVGPDQACGVYVAFVGPE